MTKEAILNELKTRKNGTFMCMVVEQDKSGMLTAQAKKDGHTLTKSAKVVVRHGVQHVGNLQSYRAVYGAKTPGGLPWGEWDVPGIIIRNTNKKTGTTKEYLRCYVSGIPGQNIYFLDGRQVSYTELLATDLIKESSSKGDQTGILCYNIDDIVRILPKRADRVKETVEEVA